MLNFALIGAGRIGKMHAEIINSKSHFEGKKVNLLSNSYCQNAKLDDLIKDIKNF